MPSSKIAALLMAGVLALTACDSDSTDEADGGGDANTTSTAPSVEDVAEEDLQRARSALLQLGDMPAGWSETSGDDDADDGNVTADEEFAECLGIDVEDLEAPEELTFNSTFTDGDTMEVSSSASVWGSAEEAESRLEERTSEEALACFPEVLDDMVDDLVTDADEDVTINGIDVGRLNLDLPADAIAIRMTISMSAQEFDVDVYLDTVLGTVDNIGWSVTIEDVFDPPDPESTAEYAALVHGRLTGDTDAP